MKLWIGRREKHLILLALITALAGLIACAAPASEAEKERIATLESEASALRQEISGLRENVARLSYNTASGGGVNMKFMPDPKTGQPTVPLPEVFSFDRNHAMCRVDTNPQAFKMPTFKMGEVTIEPHQFFMSMVATTVDEQVIETKPDGKRTVTMRGGLDCSTEVGQGTVTIGSRTAAEHVTYKIVAVDGGIGGGKAGDSFAFTAFFDPQKAPINYAIFGPEFTFTGEIVEGEVSIVDPKGSN